MVSFSNLDLHLYAYFLIVGLPLELVLLHKRKKEECHPGQRRYSSLMKQFAHTLYFYSPKAYSFLQEHFTLPDGRTIRRWLSTFNCEPGILKEVLGFLEKHVEENVSLKNCALIFDSMAIRSETVWDNEHGKYTGNVNYGGIVDVDFEMAATEALFFQIVSYSKPFKCPVAYFLINKVDANLQTHLIKSILRSLYEIGINVRSLTSDGASANIVTYQKLGCKMDIQNLVEFFHHPCNINLKVYCMLDTCHMLKLARNALAEKQIESSLGEIKWSYIKELDIIQKNEQLSLANSLTSYHVNFKNKIMNVKLAAQTLSSGVADAIEYLDKVCNIKEFSHSEATVQYIRKIDKIFDILNCRNPFGKGFKAPIRPATLNYFEEVFSDVIEYLKSLKIDNVLLIHHMRKTFAVGFILTMKSTLALAKDLFMLNENPLQYFLSYKCSQDHLELFFSCIRSRGGWNNNPNSRQLKWALRQLLFTRSIKASVNANCISFENYCTPTFEFRSQNRQQITDSVTDSTKLEADVNSYISLLSNKNLTDFQENVIFYIAGFVVRNLIIRTSCNDCINILLFNDNDTGLLDHNYIASSHIFHKFTNFITHGGLVYSSRIVFEIIKFCEKQFRIFLEKDNIHTTEVNIKKLFINTALHHFAANISNFKPPHPAVEDISEEPHELQIIRKTLELFLKCRMHHHTKLINLRIHGNKATVRQKMTKLILFKNC